MRFETFEFIVLFLLLVMLCYCYFKLWRISELLSDISSNAKYLAISNWSKEERDAKIHDLFSCEKRPGAFIYPVDDFHECHFYEKRPEDFDGCSGPWKGTACDACPYETPITLIG